MRRTIAVAACAGLLALTPGMARASTEGAAPAAAPNAGAAPARAVPPMRVPGSPGPVAVVGTTAYIGAGDDTGIVAVADTRTGRVTGQIPVRPYPSALAVSADGSRLFVASLSTGWVSEVDLKRRSVVAEARVGSGPEALALSPDGSRLYAAVVGQERVTAIDTTDMSVVGSVRVPGLAGAVAADPTSGRLYALVDYEAYAMAVIDAASLAVIATVDLDRASAGWQSDLLVSPDGRRAFAMVNPPPPAVAGVQVVDLATRRPTVFIPVGGDLRDAVLDPEGEHVYLTAGGSDLAVPRGSGTLIAVVDTTRNAVVGTLTAPWARLDGTNAQEAALVPAASAAVATVPSRPAWLARYDLADLATTPTYPLDVVVRAGRTSATVSWRTPAVPNGAVTRYLVTTVPQVEGPGGRAPSCLTTGTTCRLSGLEADVAYRVRVQAANAAGWGTFAWGPLVHDPGAG